MESVLEKKASTIAGRGEASPIYIYYLQIYPLGIPLYGQDTLES